MKTEGLTGEVFGEVFHCGQEDALTLRQVVDCSTIWGTSEEGRALIDENKNRKKGRKLLKVRIVETRLQRVFTLS